MPQTCPACGYESVPDGKDCPLCGVAAEEVTLGVSEMPTVGLPPRDEAGDPRFKPGDLFLDRWRLEAVCGRGGMGTVYRVTELASGRVMALKVLSREAADEPDGIDRFRREVEILSRLKHAAVPAIYGFGVVGDRPYFLEELLEGGDLKSSIRSRGAFPAPEAAALVATMADALEAAHRLGVIHRDVKPQNILLAKDGSARLVDFGVARSVARDMKTITKTDVVLGTPEYMSPEQLDSHRVDARSDVYSLGIVLFELLTGQLPFTGDTPLGLAIKHKTEPPPLPRSLKADVPAWLERVVLKCLEKDKVKRYATAGELAADLRRKRTTVAVRQRRLPNGDQLVEDDADVSGASLVLSAAREKTGWTPGMALVFEGRHHRLEEVLPAVAEGERWTYRFVPWPEEAVLRLVVDYEADAAERAARPPALGERLKGWFGKGPKAS